MATIADMEAAKASIISASGTNIPGLNKDAVVQGIVNTDPQYKAKIDAVPKEKQADVRNSFVTTVETTMGDFIDEQIAAMQMSYGTIVTGVEQLGKTVATMTTQALVPSVITVGTATSTANPAYVILENINKVNMLMPIVDNLLVSFLSLLHASKSIKFVLPDEVLAVLKTIAKLKTVIKYIPIS